MSEFNSMKFTSHKLKKVFAVIAWLLIYFLVGNGPLSNLVVCFGADGHIEVGTSRDGFCCLSSSVPSKTDLSFFSILDDTLNNNCGPCIDVPIFISNSDQNIVLAFGPTPQIKALPLSAFSFSQPVLINTENTHTQILSSIHSSLASIRTVVLLI